MPKLRVHAFSLSVDGFGAGADQALENPLGIGGESLHEWFFPTATWMSITGREGGETGIDEDFAAEGFDGIGATIMGRNMFGPIRGEWPDDEWKGWWGPNPPYHHPTFVLTHHPRADIPMEGGTTFHFVTGGIEEALARATEAAGGLDIRLGGGVSTVRQYLQAGLVDELHVAVSPVLLGRGERLLDLADLPDRYEIVEVAPSKAAVHYRIHRR